MYNCIVIDDECYAREALETSIEKVPFLHLLGSFDHPLPAMELLANKQVDIVFSDIQMPDLDGITFLKSLKQPPVFIFVTGIRQYAVESFELDVLDFIVKPFDFLRFLKAANKARAYLESTRSQIRSKDYLILKDRAAHTIVRFADIYAVQSNKDYVTVRTVEKAYLVWKTMSFMESNLVGDNFIRVHKSHLVNLDFVTSVTAVKILMKGNLGDIPIGTQYRDGLFRRMGID